ncbi:ATP synthase delta chain [Gordonia araii NBRC 100433]|uniref:ATP synthase subunit delta n=1 Tax=Gordonia araii NBRC 100433 TaxID=1073574 RepID=G7H6Q8_9ACTN|nr:F0F1 ATP synthase subunit delta [Gordonia araii]NNG98621.1 F0F1 ATP synthase subunit delta [Gordonia araii NBRC 100433]GAB11533.1 ATP synthase delta chain [Gordonia araii NBRC 100433]
MYAASSREALARARSVLESAVDSADSGATTGDELLAVSRLLEGNRALVSALSEAAVPPAERGEVARTILAGKVGEPTRDVVAAVAGGEWSTSADLVSGVHDLGVEALLRSAAAAGNGDAVEDELFRLGRIVTSDPELEQALSDRARSTADRAELLRSLIAGKVNPVTEKLAVDAVERARQAPGDALAALADSAAAIDGRRVAHVRAAAALSDEQQAKLASDLEADLGSPVTLHVDVDPALLGGVVVRVGDEQIDGSVAGRFAAVRRGLR